MSKNLHLNPELFGEEEVSQAPLRAGFGTGLVKAGDEDPNVVALCSDLTGSTKMDGFAKKYPERFFETGIAEQSMASVASGMAAMGRKPFISSYAMFSPGRNWEQIRTTLCYNGVPTVIAGSHAGISVGPDGGTHQAVEDIAITRVIPNMIVLTPCDSVEAEKATLAAAKSNTPVYLRLARENTPIMTTEKTPFEIGKAEVYFRPDGDADVGVIASGPVLYNALQAAKDLEEEDIKVRVMNMATVKPMDREAVVKLARETGRIVTVEEHQRAGGMGSAVAEVLAQEEPVPMRFVGVDDKFGQSGTPDELIQHYGMDVDSIKQSIRDIMHS